MEVISLKMENEMLNNIDTILKKNNFSTRTEFIRTAIREKLDSLKKEELIKLIFSYHGKSKRKTSDDDLERAREKALQDLIKEKGWK
jgi:metal-responsive CopG/Arc/MetJ family transcriptional regulator